MIEMRFHGRGGQGTVKGCQLLAKTFVADGKYGQFIPAFGVERKGAPVYGYLREDETPIRYNCQVYYPDVIVVSDRSIMETINVYEGAKENAVVIINTTEAPSEIKAPEGIRVCTVDATNLALKTIKVDIPNTVMLGAIAKVLDIVNEKILREKVAGGFGESNALAFDEGYSHVRIG